MKNYRILEIGGRFYPQYRCFLLLWFDLVSFDNGGSNGFNSLQNARAAITQVRNRDDEISNAKVVWSA